MRNLSGLFFILASWACTPADQTKNTADSSTAKKDTAAIQQKKDPGISSPVMQTDKPVYAIFQDREGYYWFGTKGDGVFRYDGNSFMHYTVRNGLPVDFVQRFGIDKYGRLWLSANELICWYSNGYFYTLNQYTSDTDKSDRTCNIWYNTINHINRYDGSDMDVYELPLLAKDSALLKNKKSYNSFPYTVYCLLDDDRGNTWFGTAALGLCRFDGKNYTYFTDNGLGRAAIRCMVQDNAGNLWFGNNGMGLYRYDGKTFTNFTAEHGLSNTDFLKTSHVTNKPGTLARVFAAAKDNSGNLWFGTIDAGAWRWDGNALVNYTKKDGLNSTAVHTIYLDQSGNLLFGGDSGRVFRFDGSRFVGFAGKGAIR